MELPVALDPSLSTPLAMIVAGLDAMSEQAPADLPAARALLEASVLLVQADRLRALTLSRVADVDTRRLHDLDDCPSTAVWVAEQQTSMTRADVALARKLDRVPLVAARITAGGLSVDGGVKISRALGKLRPHVDRPDGMIDGQPACEVLPAVIVDGVSQLVGQAYGGLAEDDPRLVRMLADLIEITARPATEIARLEAAFVRDRLDVPRRRVLARCTHRASAHPAPPDSLRDQPDHGAGRHRAALRSHPPRPPRGRQDDPPQGRPGPRSRRLGAAHDRGVTSTTTLASRGVDHPARAWRCLQLIQEPSIHFGSPCSSGA